MCFPMHLCVAPCHCLSVVDPCWVSSFLGIIVVEADVGHTALFVFLCVFGMSAPFLGVFQTLSSPMSQISQIGHTVWDCLFHQSQLYLYQDLD